MVAYDYFCFLSLFSRSRIDFKKLAPFKIFHERVSEFQDSKIQKLPEPQDTLYSTLFPETNTIAISFMCINYAKSHPRSLQESSMPTRWYKCTNEPNTC